jgi:nucleotide-binding universal stress UspA family protein
MMSSRLQDLAFRHDTCKANVFDNKEGCMINISRILCPVDFFPASLSALTYATALASNYDAKLKVLHVVTPVGPLAEGLLVTAADVVDSMKKESERRLAKTLSKVKAGGVAVESEVRVGNVHTEIKRAIQGFRPDLIAMGTHGRQGVERWFMGSATERLLRHNSVPLFTTSTTKKPRRDAFLFRRILVATDFSDGTADALKYAFSIAQENEAAITLLHVIEAPLDTAFENRDRLIASTEKNLSELIPPGAESWCDVRTRIETGTPYRVILKILDKEKFDLLVLNIHGKGMLERVLLGSTAELVVRAARSPVMLIPPMGKTTRKPRARKHAA